MSVIECNKLHGLIVKKINSWPQDTVNNNLISNLSNNLSYISNNFSYNFGNISFSNGLNINSNKFIITSNDSQSNKFITNGKSINDQLKNNLSNNINGNNEINNSVNDPKNCDKVLLPNSSSNHSITNQINNLKLEEELIESLNKLNQKCDFLVENGNKHDYTGKKVNGYFSMLRIVQCFFELVLCQIEKKKRKLIDYIEIANLLIFVLESMEDYVKKYSDLRLIYEKKDFIEIKNDEINKKSLLIKQTDNEKYKNLDLNENSDGSSNDSDDNLEDSDDFDNISSNLIKMSSDLANSIESMKTQCEEDFDILANSSENYDQILDEIEFDDDKEKIEDYYRKNESKNNEIIDNEYGKEIKKEEYESILQKYYKRFNFNFKMSKNNNCTSPVAEENSPKKELNNINVQSSRPDSPRNKNKSEKKYYKYFTNLTKNLEENFSKFTSNSETNIKLINEENSSAALSSPKVFLTKSYSSNELFNKYNDQTKIIYDETDDNDEIEESKEEKDLRVQKLDEYTLSKFKDSNDDLHLITPPMLYFYEGFTLTLNCEKELGLIYGRVGPFWYCKSAANIVNLVRNLIVILTSPPSKSIASLCNTDYCGRVFAHRQVNSTLDSLLQGIASLEVKAYNKRYFKYLYRDHVIYGKTIKLPVYSEFLISNYGNKLTKTKDLVNNKEKQNNTNNKSSDLEINKQNKNLDEKLDNTSVTNSEDGVDKIDLDNGYNSRTVRCRLINYVRSQNETEICENSHKCLLFHVHGGGFVLSSPDSHELYLRDWAVKLKGIPILSVDYVLRKRFPSAPQDILDVYMSIVNPKNSQLITEMIGFQPEKIVLAGDSAGANLIMSLICCLNDIRKNNPEFSNLFMPTSIICIYGAFDIRAVMSPSKFISSIDPILHHGNIMAMAGAYGGIAQKIRKTLWSRIKNRRSNAWYRVSERKLKSRFKNLSKALESYFASPLIYPYFEDIKDISLHLISTHFCPLIDDSVVLYKAWKGEITFDVYSSLPHAFLNFCDRSEEAKIATDKCAERLIQAFQKS